MSSQVLQSAYFTPVYDSRLVTLSVIVAIFASFIALDLARRVLTSDQQSARYWLLGGSLAMGTGIWSMHFVAMMAFSLPIPLGYDIFITFMSWVAAVFVSGMALFIASRRQMDLPHVIAGGLAMGVGICAMHYTGMFAMKMEPEIDWQLGWFLTSVAIAVGASFAALTIFYWMRTRSAESRFKWQLVSAVIMGLAISGMHYSGMAAAEFPLGSVCRSAGSLNSVWLGGTIGGATMFLLTVTLLTSLLDARLQARTALLAASVQQTDMVNRMLQTLEHEVAERQAADQSVRALNAELLIANQTLVTRTEEAEAANRAKADFLANMSHEIRTPMNAVLGLAYLLDQRQLDRDSSELVKKIRNAGRSLQAVLNDILDFSKIEAGQMNIEQAPFLLSSVLNNLAAIMSANVGNKDLELVISPPPNGYDHLLGDAHRLEQVLINLTANAIKFTDHGSVKVDIRQLARTDNTVTLRFAVTDTGIGIPFEKQASIFMPFSQADASTTRRFGGTGLGLTICHYLISSMGGEIGVTSTLDEGSEFWFTLPFEWVEATEWASPEMTRLEILIADDSDIARENLALSAQSIGWEPTQADSGDAAVQKVQSRLQSKSHYDVLLLDWKMPGVDGLQAAKAIRQAFRGETLPILLMVTAYSREELLKQPDIDLVDGILTKPITGSALYNSVAEALRRRGKAGANEILVLAMRKEKRIPRVRVLVVDDSDINREVAQRILEADGAVVSMAHDGKDALAWLHSHPAAVDIVLMDIQMPVMDGYEATRLLRTSAEFAGLPVIALTAGAFKAEQEAALAAGMNAFVSKPFDVEELMSTIQQLTHCQSELVEAGQTNTTDASVVNALPQNLPGIAVNKGLTLWQDLNTYCKFLLKFTQDYGDCWQQLNHYYEEHNHMAAKALAHKLKGTAASLALMDIARYAGELETISVNHDEPGEALANLQLAMAIAFMSVERLVADQNSGAAPPPFVLDIERATPLLTELLRALDTDTPKQANLLLEMLKAMLPQDAISTIRTCVDNFDFRQAEIEVQQVASTLNIRLQE